MRSRAGFPRPFRSATLIVAGLAAALVLGSCSKTKASQGYIVDETLLTSIQPGVDNRDSVSKTLGRPTFAAQFDAGEWYYVSRNTAQYAFLKPKLTGQSILVISFDANGNVSKVERRGMDQVANISPNPDKTPVLGREQGFFDDIFGNIGQVGALPGGAGGGATP
jgi:outer membrane protein assembly factor BamE (lipoprotein component of BamABCDE complex)